MSDLQLGKIITTEQQRDAIHIAVAPVAAGEELRPGERIGINADGEAVISDDSPVGIVDPFLSVPRVSKGERFWIFLMPNTVTGMRHHWSHPAFPNDARSIERSRAWIAGFAARIDQTVNRLMEAAEKWADDPGGFDAYTYDNSERYKAHWDDFPEFWKHWEIVTGRKAPENDPYFFTCSC